MTENELLMLLHDWVLVGEYDGGYLLGRCHVCGLEELLDVTPAVAA